MDTTSLSLLERLKRAGPSSAEWARLQDMYLPLLRGWLGRVPGLGDEADDLSQEVLVILFRELPAFQRRRHGSFRAWLRRITVNRVRTFYRKGGRPPDAAGGSASERFLAELEDPRCDLTRQWDRDHDRHVVAKLLALVRGDFEEHTWQAFTRFALDEEPAARVAHDLGMSEGAVIQAKARVLKRLREEAGDLMDCPPPFS